MFLNRKAWFVKPVAANTELFGWLTSEMTYAEAFMDDMNRYGLLVALYNIRYLWRNRA